jgi:hypothetical protein
MEFAMPHRPYGGNRFGFGAAVALALGIALSGPALAQTRTLTVLADVPALMPAPYHPNATTALYSATLYDGSAFHGGVRYWH